MIHFIDLLTVGIVLLLRVYPDYYLRVFEDITVNTKEKAVIITFTAFICVFTYYLIGLKNSVFLLASFGVILSVARLFKSWKTEGRFLDVIFLLAFFTIFLRSFYEIPYLPTIMTFSAVIRIIAAGEYLKENKKKLNIQSILSEIFITIAMIFMALLVIAIYMEKDDLILPFLIGGMGFIVFDIIVKRL